MNGTTPAWVETRRSASGKRKDEPPEPDGGRKRCGILYLVARGPRGSGRGLTRAVSTATPAKEKKAAVALAVERWDGYFGGQGRQGRGRMTVEKVGGDETPVDAYLEHVEAHRDEMRAGLTSGTLGTERALCVLQ